MGYERSYQVLNFKYGLLSPIAKAPIAGSDVDEVLPARTLHKIHSSNGCSCRRTFALGEIFAAGLNHKCCMKQAASCTQSSTAIRAS